MRTPVIALPLVSLLFAACAAPQPQPTPEQMQEAWIRAGTPGAEHRALDPFVGTWNATVSMWMAPDAPPDVSTGTMVNTWGFDGRFLEQRFSGSMGGMPFTGLATWGFDVAAGCYCSTWTDSMSTTISVSHGAPSKDGKTFELTGSHTDPVTGKPKTTEEVITITGPDRHTMEMFDSSSGKRVKAMEIVYERAH
jgi:hypothetical protein